TDESGLHDLVDKSRDLLLQEHITHEKEVVEKFLETLGKDSEKAAYGKEQVDKALSYGAVQTLLLSESLSDEEIEAYEEKALETDATVEIISVETREGIQLRDLGKIGAILRFAIH
ncbi:peptide chain release factor 1, partial [Candidatus Woesearchaeota archaeon]|nr:peptide chain release factor 1 [Candidatus Woesearchaeota archaeon]